MVFLVSHIRHKKYSNYEEAAQNSLIIDIENAFQMVSFVLENDCRKSGNGIRTGLKGEFIIV
jgi:hypothetical protein